MIKRYSRISTAVLLLVGIMAGWGLSLFKARPLHASAGDRFKRDDHHDRPRARALRRSDEIVHCPRCGLHPRLQGRAPGGLAPHLPPIDFGNNDHRVIRRARPGRRFQDRPGYRPLAPLHDDDRFARPLHRRLGSALRRRDNQQSDGRLPHPSSADFRQVLTAKIRARAAQVLRRNENQPNPPAPDPRLRRKSPSPSGRGPG